MDSAGLGFVLLLLGIVFYFLPGIVAIGREHPNTTSIFVLNLFLGWTLVGWVIALVWAVGNIDKSRVEVLSPGLVPEVPIPKAWREIDEQQARDAAAANPTMTANVWRAADEAKPVVAPALVKCPYCAEDIKAEAIKCRYCLSDLT